MNRLHFTAFATERDLRQAILEAGRLCYSVGLTPANAGDISARAGEDKIVITPAGLCLGRLEIDDLLVVDLDGKLLKADHKRKRQPPSDLLLHLEFYRQRPEVRAVIQAQPTYAVALSVAEIAFPTDVLPAMLEQLGPVPSVRFTLPGADSAEAVHPLVAEHNALLLRNRSAITVGTDLDEAMNRLEWLEAVAKIMVVAQTLGKVSHLPAEMLLAMTEQRRNTGQ